MRTLTNAGNLGATYATPWVDCRASKRVHFQWSSDNVSTPTGAITIEESSDPVALSGYLDNPSANTTSSAAKVVNISADSTRVTVVGTGLTVNAANETVVTVLNPAAFVRLKYTRAGLGETATANCWAHVAE
jgi:hypothetical protein